MITDVFFRRYGGVVVRDAFAEDDRRLFNQLSKLVSAPLWEVKPDGDKIAASTEASLKIVHDRIANELGWDELSPRSWWHTINLANGNKQSHKYDYALSDVLKVYFNRVFNPAEHNADDFVKQRLSVVELAFRLRWEEVQAANAQFPANLADAQLRDDEARFRGLRRAQAYVTAQNQRMNDALAAVILELNERLRLAGYPLDFHNGMLQFTDDKLLNAQIAEPFWALVADPIWGAVEEQMKEALDRRDAGDRTAPFHAASALESCIKIISKTKGWTRGDEKGAAAFINNLVSEKNGRFIEIWEGDLLIRMFGDVRNPFGHGPEELPLPNLTPQQDNWVIDTSMVWIKSLITRL